MQTSNGVPACVMAFVANSETTSSAGSRRAGGSSAWAERTSMRARATSAGDGPNSRRIEELTVGRYWARRCAIRRDGSWMRCPAELGGWWRAPYRPGVADHSGMPFERAVVELLLRL